MEIASAILTGIILVAVWRFATAQNPDQQVPCWLAIAVVCLAPFPFQGMSYLKFYLIFLVTFLVVSFLIWFTEVLMELVGFTESDV